MPQHHKVAPLSDAAFRLHITAMAWSVEGKTDGRVPKAIPATLTRAPVGKKLKDALKELTESGVWVAKGDDFEIHDFLQWNLSAADIAARSEAKARAGASGGRRSGEARQKQQASNSEAPASPVVHVATKLVEAKPKPLSQSLPNPEEEAEPAAPSPEALAELNRDRMPMHLAWCLLAENIAAIEIAGVPAWAIDELIARFKAHFIADPKETATRAEWVQRCTKWVLKDWRNPRTRPEKPAAEPQPGDLGAYGKAEEWA